MAKICQLHADLHYYLSMEPVDIRKQIRGHQGIINEKYNIDEKFLLRAPNEHEGEFLQSEILRGGIFGQYDDRITYISDEHR